MNTPATPLQFRSADEASAFLSRLSLTDPAPTHRLLLQFFDALVRQPLPPTDQAVVLTQAEKPLLFLQEEAARHYLIKSLPYSGDDLARFQRTVSLWQQAGKAWRAAELPEVQPRRAADRRPAQGAAPPETRTKTGEQKGDTQ